MNEVLCGRTPAILSIANLKQAIAFYRDDWGFTVHQQVPGVLAIIKRESVTVHLLQRREDMMPETFACKLLVDDLQAWQHGEGGLQSASGHPPATLTDEGWGSEMGVSDCEGNRLQLVQSAPHLWRRKAGA